MALPAGSKILILLLIQFAGVQTSKPIQVHHKYRYLWPTLVVFDEFVGKASKQYEGAQKVYRVLARLAQKGYDRYINEYLPIELEKDKEFADEFKDMDHTSKWNNCFHRWQRRVLARLFRTNLNAILDYGAYVPNVKGVGIIWDEFYDTKALKGVKKTLGQKFKQFYRTAGVQAPPGSDIFVWTEVYRPGEASVIPRTFTGYQVFGCIALAMEKGQMTLTLMDPRGGTAPFGQKEEFQLETGDYVMMPSFTEFYLSPNIGNSTATLLYYAFLPDGGHQDFDWEDDPLGGMETRDVNQMVTVPELSAAAAQKSEL
eukprot:TRINITY_DN35750_c0_g1_i2.p1 TRINITY_DN35750_c0_g1~~TRINITY_DN35750_c0_g1_i2.p1  ORF type:complete len:347 (-),score=53.47 TRINITY_DN35750_c0_g1_i2:463-1404(-)